MNDEGDAEDDIDGDKLKNDDDDDGGGGDDKDE